jgi:DNA-binding transcriptional MocR family regulator
MSTSPSRATTLYEDVAAHVAQAISAGTLRPGDRLPSVRKLSQQQRVSVSTVLQAYLHLESQGLIEARPQSGHYVKARPVAAVVPPASRPGGAPCQVQVTSLVARVYAAARDPKVVNLGAGLVSPSLLPTRKLSRITAALSRDLAELSVSYDLPPGNVDFRREVARRSIEWGCALSPDEIVTTCGASEAVILALRAVTRPGDAVAIESPTYYGLLQAIESLSRKAVEIPTCPQSGMVVDELERALDRHRIRAVLTVPNFHNPYGCVMPDADKRRLVELCASRGIAVIEDDIYGDLHHGPERPRALKSFDPDGSVLLCGSFSKTLAPGYRVGFCAPGRWREQVELLKFSQSIATPTLNQLAIAEFLRTGGYDHHLRGLRRAVTLQVQRVQAAIAECMPEGTRSSRPAGGCVVWVELPGKADALRLYERALQAGVGIAPGVIFSPKERYRNCFRVTCGEPWSPALQRAFATLGDLARS